MLDFLEHSLDDAPPRARTAHDNHATLLVSWWCTIFALVIILLRVAGRFVRSERLFTEDTIMFFSIIPLFARMGFVHVILRYGTNNAVLAGLTALEIHQRTIGSKLVLASRIFYALFIWTTKWSVSQFLKRLTYATWNPIFERMLRAIRFFLALTFVAVIIGTLAECQPFDHYWQVVPDPGPRCRNGYAQLLTMGISDIITDLLLILFPILIIFRSTLAFRRKITLSLLFMLSACLIAVTAVRIAAIFHVDGLQQRRSLWASLEILAAAAATNTLVLGSFVRDRGTKKSKFKPTASDRLNSEGGPSINRHMTLQHWGGDSDEELFRSLGSRLDSAADALTSDPPVPRPAPKATNMLHVDTSVGSPIREGPFGIDEITSADDLENFRPQSYAAFLRQSDGSPSGLQKKKSVRAPRSPSLKAVRLSNIGNRQDFDAVDWSGMLVPEDMHISDAGGLLPEPESPNASQSILRRGTDSAEVSPLNARPRSGLPDLGRLSRMPLASLAPPPGPHPSARVSTDIPRAPSSSYGRPSLSQQHPAPSGPDYDDMQLGDAGGLLT